MQATGAEFRAVCRIISLRFSTGRPRYVSMVTAVAYLWPGTRWVLIISISMTVFNFYRVSSKSGSSTPPTNRRICFLRRTTFGKALDSDVLPLGCDVCIFVLCRPSYACPHLTSPPLTRYSPFLAMWQGVGWRILAPIFLPSPPLRCSITPIFHFSFFEAPRCQASTNFLMLQQRSIT